MTSQANTTQLQALIDLASQGNKEAYGELIGQASTRLLHLTRKMLRGFPQLQRWEGTDDVFQTAAMRLYRSLSDVQPASVREFLGLATLQIRRTLIDLARHHCGPGRHGDKHHSDGDGGALQQAASSPDSLDDWLRLHQAVEQLPADEREAFQLVWYAGMPQQEIAQLLDISVSTVQRRWYRAQSALGAILRADS
ncbi:sigma-70 family RNA polymerase sigma factor [Blastopirellula sp. JC732]|uniref:Sigma-70 family RNA polymerase sigma factor n=1 Tax=Blastopirellula sediminis TaxID=2894196 RepID=A0A9X1SIL5_9BACT|nr:sigma-70 family RNA polymerase sigma factor [Blastopirellula sediminis]MCC9609054.1 sigma-70 family RNA polymerase sigma factor [Blastopirellula sediminis]MCC9628169.1 sigma-70 family RNA polymerase sigma factor [Blastopirellula sediminis]